MKGEPYLHGIGGPLDEMPAPSDLVEKTLIALENADSPTEINDGIVRDIEKLEAELAKLRAVAEKAIEYANAFQVYHDVYSGQDTECSIAAGMHLAFCENAVRVAALAALEG